MMRMMPTQLGRWTTQATYVDEDTDMPSIAQDHEAACQLDAPKLSLNG